MSNSRVPAMLIVVLLVVLGILLFTRLQGLNKEIEAAPALARDKTNLHAAAQAGDAAAIQKELAAGADVNAEWDASGGKRGLTPLMLASLSGKPDAVQAVLAAKPNVRIRATEGQTALLYAAGWGNAATLRLLLDAGASPDARSDDGRTALMLAASRGPAENVALLLERGVDAKARNKWGQAAIHLAVQSGSADKVRLLLNSGADPSVPDDSGATPLHLAAAHEAPGLQLLHALLEAKADPNRSDREGVTPLMKAADLADEERAAALLAAGASPKAKDNSGRDAAAWARQRDDEPGRALAAILEAAAK